MRIGITGHQERPGIDWGWVRNAIGRELSRVAAPLVGLSSLARGADQVFAQAVLDAGGALIFVRPTAEYERHFDGDALTAFLSLRRAAETEIVMPPEASDEDAFLAAGQRIASESEILIAVWDGKGSAGKGGTADIVNFARARSIPVVHVDPFSRTASRLK